MIEQLQHKIAEQEAYIIQLAEQQKLLAVNQQQLVRMCLDLQKQIIAYTNDTKSSNNYH